SRYRAARHHRDAAAAHLPSGAGVGPDYARRHLLRRPIWRLDHRDPGNLPGETSSVVTCIDGHQMARQGRAGSALAIAALGSFFAGCVATAVVALFSGPLVIVAGSFQSPDYFGLLVFGMVAAVVLAQGSVVRSVAMVVLG